MFFDHANPESSKKIFWLDVQRAQQPFTINVMLKENKTILINIPLGCKSRVHPLDVPINKSFRDFMSTYY